MGSPLITKIRPALLGFVIGVLLALGISVFAPETDLDPGDSRFVIGIVAGVFLVPASIVTAYVARLAVNNVRKMPSLRFVWIFAALFFTLGVTISACSEWIAARRYAREGRTTSGTVIEAHPEDHDTLLVAYTAGGVDYRRRSSGPRVARSYKSGDPIQVFYYVSAPGAGFCREPRWRPDMLILSWIMAAGVLPLFLVGLGGALVLWRQRAAI